jgi:prenyltransferase beta subunit
MFLVHIPDSVVLMIRCQSEGGGFGGGPGQDAHVCSTFAAVRSEALPLLALWLIRGSADVACAVACMQLGALAIMGELPHWLNLAGIDRFLSGLKNPDGSFRTALAPGKPHCEAGVHEASCQTHTRPG